MLYTILTSLFVLLCLLLILIILVQKGKSSLGLGSMGGGTQLLFGGSGGQDLFQKVTWIMGALFMTMSLVLAMIKRPTSADFLGKLAQSQPVQMPKMPTAQQPAPEPSTETQP